MFETSRCKLSTVLLISDGAFQSFIFSFIGLKELYILSYSGSREKGVMTILKTVKQTFTLKH